MKNVDPIFLGIDFCGIDTVHLGRNFKLLLSASYRTPKNCISYLLTL